MLQLRIRRVLLGTHSMCRAVKQHVRSLIKGFGRFRSRVIARGSTLELALLKQRLSNIVVVGALTQVHVFLCQTSLVHICSCQTNVSAFLSFLEVETCRKLDYPALRVAHLAT